MKLGDDPSCKHQETAYNLFKTKSAKLGYFDAKIKQDKN